MQEWGWLNWNDFGEMVEEIGKRPDSRRLRLAACACARRVWHLLDDIHLRTAVELAEDFADHSASWEQLKRARQSVAGRVEEVRSQLIGDKSALPDWVSDDEDAARWEMEARDLPVARAAGVVEVLLRSKSIGPDALLMLALGVNRLSPPTGVVRSTLEVYCGLLRDIFGNPFRPVAFDPSWRTDTAASLARHMYDARDFSAMPILADALQDAGCDDNDILAHCRDPHGAHVRGCWVVDLVLGKE